MLGKLGGHTAFTSPTTPCAAAGEASCASALTRVRVGLCTPFLLSGWPRKIIHHYRLHSLG